MSHVLRGSKDQDLEGGVEGIDTMVKELSQGTGLLGSSPARHILASFQYFPQSRYHLQIVYLSRSNSRLRSVNGVKGLVQEQADGPRVVDPGRAIGIQARVIPQEGQEVGDDKGEAGEGDEVRGHPYREALDDDVGVEGLEDVFGEQGAVDARVLVVFERGELALADVDHDECVFLRVCRPTRRLMMEERREGGRRERGWRGGGEREDGGGELSLTRCSSVGKGRYSEQVVVLLGEVCRGQGGGREGPLTW